MNCSQSVVTDTSKLVTCTIVARIDNEEIPCIANFAPYISSGPGFVTALVSENNSEFGTDFHVHFPAWAGAHFAVELGSTSLLRS